MIRSWRQKAKEKTIPDRLSKIGVSYIRVSSKDQEDGYSLDSQEKLIREYAVRKGITILQEYRDVETAKKAGRTNFSEMIKFLRNHPTCRIILAEKTDRLYRNIKDWVTLDDLSREIHMVKEGVILSPDSRASEKLMHGVKVLFAKNYIDNLSEETKKGQLEKAEQGIYPSYAPIGYLNVGNNGKRTIEPDPIVAPYIKQLYELYVTGNYSLLTLAEEINARGMRYRGSGNKILKSLVHRVLRNPIYYGEFEYAGKIHKGIHEPLIEKWLWDKAQRMLEKKGSCPLQPNKHSFAFSDLLTCGRCKCAIIGEQKKGKYIYYHCTNKRGKCGEPYIREEKLDQLLGDVFKHVSFDEEMVGLIKEAVLSFHQDKVKFQEEEVDRLQMRYKKLQTRIDKMYIDKIDGNIAEAYYEEHKAVFRKEQDEILGKIENHQKADDSTFELTFRTLELAGKASAKVFESSPKEKSQFLKILTLELFLRDGKIIPKWRHPFDLLTSVSLENTPSDPEKINWLQR